MTSRSTWKRFERETARLFGGTRSGATGFASSDVKGVEGFAIECKYRTKLPVFLVKILQQAESAMGARGRIPIGILGERGGSPRRDSIAIMYTRDLIKLIESGADRAALASLDATLPPAPAAADSLSVDNTEEEE